SSTSSGAPRPRAWRRPDTCASSSHRDAARDQACRMTDRLSDSAFRTIVEEAPDAIVLVDGSGQITYVNAKAEDLFGYARARLLGQRIEVLIPEDRRSMHVIPREVYEDRPEKRPMGLGLDLVGLRADGSTFPAAISLSPFVDGD